MLENVPPPFSKQKMGDLELTIKWPRGYIIYIYIYILYIYICVCIIFACCLEIVGVLLYNDV